MSFYILKFNNILNVFFYLFGRIVTRCVYSATRAEKAIFTHPIFESDFDCLTGKNRLHAFSLLSPLASDKPKTLPKKIHIYLNLTSARHR